MNRHLDWLNQAQRDLEKAKIDFQHQYWEWACFTCQQAAEKAVKALLLFQGYDAWGHAITPMLRSLEEPLIQPDLIEKSQILDAYYIQTRYPSGFAEGKPADYFNQSKAREALDAAQSIFKFCQDHILGS
jgi:HEPN domain-containing protein